MSSSPLARTSVRRLGAAALTAVAVTGLSLAGASTASAAPGDSGEINIHKPGTPNSDPRDEVKICRFNLAAVNFETVPLVNITVTPQPATPTRPTLTAAVALTAGLGNTQDYSLPNGQYKVVWTFPGGTPKEKLFTVDCRPTGGVPAGGGGVPTVESSTAGDSGMSLGTTSALAAGGVGVLGLFLARRAARRRTHGAA
ncbi:hypothetical protein ACFY8V_30125 [Streptomyces californicus]|uniref:hypothetical protein n=1 Tax=Streptomyces TaxID=1883 RepID=UPI000BF20815|nr:MULTISPECIES: hypothetical protein [Streptomyces]MBK0372398.1 hypothetical protein [Streptomyces sp. RB110-1]MBK0384885.1 hypothetical protein [Streptomyces sp. RB110-2]MCF3166909.1 hypothetical protein [Streptomyces violaceoruber]MDW4897295.1 hypothetical protein [Streptomyces californicus]QSS89166.1 hypothetical protein H3V39_01030 [Streptomyces sp. M54]